MLLESDWVVTPSKAPFGHCQGLIIWKMNGKRSSMLCCCRLAVKILPSHMGFYIFVK